MIRGLTASNKNNISFSLFDWMMLAALFCCFILLIFLFPPFLNNLLDYSGRDVMDVKV